MAKIIGPVYGSRNVAGSIGDVTFRNTEEGVVASAKVPPRGPIAFADASDTQKKFYLANKILSNQTVFPEGYDVSGNPFPAGEGEIDRHSSLDDSYKEIASPKNGYSGMGERALFIKGFMEENKATSYPTNQAELESMKVIANGSAADEYLKKNKITDTNQDLTIVDFNLQTGYADFVAEVLLGWTTV